MSYKMATDQLNRPPMSAALMQQACPSLAWCVQPSSLSRSQGKGMKTQHHGAGRLP